jgi:hypothetical protein
MPVPNRVQRRSMILKDGTLIEAPPERIFEFFAHMEENYAAWHPDHVAFRWTKGKGLEPGVEFYFEEYIGGKLLKKTVRFTKIVNAVRQHMKEEGENLKRIVEAEQDET